MCDLNFSLDNIHVQYNYYIFHILDFDRVFCRTMKMCWPYLERFYHALFIAFSGIFLSYSLYIRNSTRINYNFIQASFPLAIPFFLESRPVIYSISCLQRKAISGISFSISYLLSSAKSKNTRFYVSKPTLFLYSTTIKDTQFR